MAFLVFHTGSWPVCLLQSPRSLTFHPPWSSPLCPCRSGWRSSASRGRTWEHNTAPGSVHPDPRMCSPSSWPSHRLTQRTVILDLFLQLKMLTTSAVRNVKFSRSVHFEDRRKVFWVPVKEVLWWITWSIFITKFQDFFNATGWYQSSQPCLGILDKVIFASLKPCTSNIKDYILPRFKFIYKTV